MINNRPFYTRVGNPRLTLSFTDVEDYPTPWTMWGSPSRIKGTHIGNVKIGPKNIYCPEKSTVSVVTCISYSFIQLSAIGRTFQKLFIGYAARFSTCQILFFTPIIFQKFYYIDPLAYYQGILKESNGSLQFSCNNNLPKGFT